MLERVLRKSIIIFLIFGFVSGCSDGETDDPLFGASLSIENSGGEEAGEFLPEETVRFSAGLINFTETGQVIEFNVDPFMDIVVRETEGGVTVWKRSEKEGFSVVTRTFIFNPNEEKTFDYSWDQVLFDKNPLEPGVYSAQAVFFPGGSDPEMGTLNGITTDEVLFAVLEPPD